LGRGGKEGKHVSADASIKGKTFDPPGKGKVRLRKMEDRFPLSERGGRINTILSKMADPPFFKSLEGKKKGSGSHSFARGGGGKKALPPASPRRRKESRCHVLPPFSLKRWKGKLLHRSLQ